MLGLEFSFLQVRRGTGLEKSFIGQGKDESQAVEAGAAMEGGMMLYLEHIKLQSLPGVQGTHRAPRERQNLLGFGQSHRSGCRAPTENLLLS